MGKPSNNHLAWARRTDYVRKLELAEAWLDVLDRDEPDTDIIDPWNNATGLEYLFAGDSERMEHWS